MHELHLARLSVIFSYTTDTFYLSLTNYIYYIINLCQPDVRKTYSVIYVYYVIYIVSVCEIHLGMLI